MLDQIIRSMFRGFGWTLGRRVAQRTPLWVAAVLLVIYLAGRSL